MNTVEEEQRLAALQGLEILDTEPEATFDMITEMLAEMLGVPHACVTLIDRERAWFKSAFGVDATEVKREPGFCATLATSDLDVLHIEDALEHPSAKKNSLVLGGPRIRFYAGAPLCTSQGYRVGTLCAFGSNPRSISEMEISSLRRLATLAMHEIELRRAQRQLARTEEALTASQRLDSLGLVASGVAHDFNNLLCSILGNTELLRAEIRSQASAEKLLDEIEATGLRASELAGQVLAYAGRDDDSPMVALGLNSLVAETYRMLRGALEYQLRVEFHFEEGLPAVIGRSTGLRQLAMNLITNAAEACDATGGVVRVTTKSDASKRNLELIVEDNGSGVSEEVRTRAFEPFFSSKPGGRGLGLAICKRITEQHGGAIAIEPRVEGGTQVRVTLPAGPSSAVLEKQGWKETNSRGHDELVLIVDDDTAIRKMACLALERAGYRTIEAGGGAEAIRVLQEHGESVNVAVLDWSMPLINGEQVLDFMRQRGVNVPVVLSSGHEEVGASAKGAMRPPVRSFLKKPYSVRELLRRVGDPLSVESR